MNKIKHIAKAAVFSSVFMLIAGCYSLPVSTPFLVTENQRVSQDNAPAQDYLLVVTHTEVKNIDEQRKQFNDYVDAIDHSLHEQPGLYGYSLRKELMGSQAWTMTVWYDEDSLDEYKVSQPHLQAMQKAPQMLVDARFARKKLKRTELPVAWEQALQILEAENRSYAF